jgi:hypothetical protein
MVNIAVIGTSHVGAIKNGWDSLKQSYPNVEVTFYGARSSMFRKAGAQFWTLSNGKLAPVTDELNSAFAYTSKQPDGLISFNNFDLIWLHGFPPRFSLSLLEKTSSSFFSESFRYLVKRKTAFCLCEQLRSAGFRGSLLVSPPPMRVIEDELKLLEPRYVYDLFESRYRDVFKELSADVLLQPKDTLTENFWTKERFGLGSEKLAVSDSGSNKHPPDDISHMNGLFGELMLNLVLN